MIKILQLHIQEKNNIHFMEKITLSAARICCVCDPSQKAKNVQAKSEKLGGPQLHPSLHHRKMSIMKSSIRVYKHTTRKVSDRH